jgi:hypothetical protein
LLDHEPCGRLRSSLELVSALLDLARSNRFIKLPCAALNFALMFNSCNTLIAQVKLTRFGSILFVIHMLCFQIFNSAWCVGHVLSNSRIQINLDCHVLRVQAC